MLNYIKTKWNDFQNWVASWLPGVKTQIVTAVGSLGSLAAVGQEYVSGIPLTALVTAKTALMISAGLFTMAFWFRRLADRNQAA